MLWNIEYFIYLLYTKVFLPWRQLLTLFNKSLQRVQRVWLVYFVIQQNLIENLKTKWISMFVNHVTVRTIWHLLLQLPCRNGVKFYPEYHCSATPTNIKESLYTIYDLLFGWYIIPGDTKINLTIRIVYLVQLFIHCLVKLQRVSSF